MKNLSCCRGFGITGFPNLVPWLCDCCIIMFADLWSFFSLKLSGWRSRWQRGGGRSDARVRPYLYLPARFQWQQGPNGWTPSPPEYEEQLTARLTSCFQHTQSHSRQGWHCRTARERGTGAAGAGLPQRLNRPGFCCCLFAAPSGRTAC